MSNKTETLDIPPAEPALQLARKEAAEPSVVGMIQTVIDRGVTQDNVAALERLVGLYERMQDKDAEKQFASAFVALQSDMPAIQAVKPVPNRDGTIRYKYAPYEEIMEKARPFLQKHGFTVTFSCDFKDTRIIQTCTLQHIGGHKRSNQFMARIGSGPPSSSEAQADGAAATYAKRQALCDALNIVVEHDNDAKAEGKPIGFDQVAYLKELVKETGSDEAAFLRFAGASTYEEIGSERYDSVVAALHKKQKK